MKPLILAHRGASAYAPENTFAAFALAFELGADGIELDATLTLDGVPVVMHDDTVDRTTNGYGEIRRMTLAQVKMLDAGANFPKYRGECVPTLEQVLQTFGQRGIVNIELKTQSVRDNGLEQAVAGIVDRCKANGRVIVSSFNPFALARMRLLAPTVNRGLLYAPNLPVYLRRTWFRPLAKPQAMHPRHDMVDARYMKWAISKRLKTNVWTIDDPAEMKRLIDLGVDSIITNKPDILRRLLDVT